jgi:hypothetical protein
MDAQARCADAAEACWLGVELGAAAVAWCRVDGVFLQHSTVLVAAVRSQPWSGSLMM